MFPSAMQAMENRQLLLMENNSDFSLNLLTVNRKSAEIEYQGCRKERVLDAITATYLCGLPEDEISTFMNNNNINRFYNIPRFLIHILGERGQYE